MTGGVDNEGGAQKKEGSGGRGGGTEGRGRARGEISHPRSFLKVSAYGFSHQRIAEARQTCNSRVVIALEHF